MKKLFVLAFFLGLNSIYYTYAQEKPITSLKYVQVISLVDSLRKSLLRYYVFPDKAISIDAYLTAQLKRGAYKDFTDPIKLSNRLENDIKTVHYDSHLHINFEPNLIAPEKISAEERSKAMKEQLATERDNNFNLQRIEILPGNIGYFLFNGFTGNVDESRPILNAALTFLSGTKSLIIDLRYNGGGNSVNRLESYFFKEKTHLFDHVNTFNKDTLSVFADPKTTDGPVLLMPIYILTSKNTFSAAEAFSNSMQSLKRAIIIGDTTGGGSHMTGTFDLKNDFIAKIPFARPVTTLTFKDWEGTGVIPNIPVDAREALYKAQETIYKELLFKAKSDKDKRKIQWATNVLKASRNLSNPNLDIYAKYVGTYLGGLNIYTKNNELFCKNPERGGTDVFKLTYVSDHIFLLDENVQIEFIKDEKDTYSSLNMLWKDGNVTLRQRDNL